MNETAPPACQRVARRIILDFIKCSALQNGERLPAVAYLSRYYESSSVTISAALDILRSEGWIDIQSGKGCYIKRSYLQSVVGRDRRLGMVLPSADKELALRLFQGVSSAVQNNGWSLMLTESQMSYELERSEVMRLFSEGCEALVLYAVSRTMEQAANDYLTCECADKAIVLVDNACVQQKRPQVIFDNFLLAYDMVMTLIRNGRKRIGYLVHTGMRSEHINPVVCQRLAGAEAAFFQSQATHGSLRVDYVNYSATTGSDCIDEYLLRWKEDPDHLDAIIMLNDQPAMNLISAALKHGIRVPGQLMVLGHDDLTAARQFSPSFGTSKPDFIMMGEMAARYAMERASGLTSHPATILLPVGVVSRGSTLSVA